MANTSDDTHIYGTVDSLEDLRRINQEIRHQMDRVDEKEQLTQLKKRSDYLCTLAKAPSWKAKFGDKIGHMLEVAKEEDGKTTRHANAVAKKHGWAAAYDPWGGR